MLGGRKLVGVVLSMALLLAVAAPAFAGDRNMDPQRDLRGVRHISAHRYLFATAGGAAIGAGLGTLLPGGGKSTMKGLLIGFAVRNLAAGRLGKLLLSGKTGKTGLDVADGINIGWPTGLAGRTPMAAATPSLRLRRDGFRRTNLGSA